MGRQSAHTDDFARWRRRFHAEIAAQYDEDFADECLAEADSDVAYYGRQGAEDQRFLELVVPALVANKRKGRHG